MLSHDVGRENCCQSPFHPRVGHQRPPHPGDYEPSLWVGAGWCVSMEPTMPKLTEPRRFSRAPDTFAGQGAAAGAGQLPQISAHGATV